LRYRVLCPHNYRLRNIRQKRRARARLRRAHNRFAI
jgi:hypothetical protein